MQITPTPPLKTNGRIIPPQLFAKIVIPNIDYQGEAKYDGKSDYGHVISIYKERKIQTTVGVATFWNTMWKVIGFLKNLPEDRNYGDSLLIVGEWNNKNDSLKKPSQDEFSTFINAQKLLKSFIDKQVEESLTSGERVY